MSNKKIMGIGVGIIVLDDKGRLLLGKRNENEKKYKKDILKIKKNYAQ